MTSRDVSSNLSSIAPFKAEEGFAAVPAGRLVFLLPILKLGEMQLKSERTSIVDFIKIINAPAMFRLNIYLLPVRESVFSMTFLRNKTTSFNRQTI